MIRSATTSASSIRIIFGFWRERSIYKKILSEASTSERDKAYALFRLVNCYAPAGNNTCGGKDVELAQRKAWHDELKSRYGGTPWAKSLKFYW